VIELDEFLLSWLFRAIGYRPIQCASLKVKDVLCDQREGAATTYSLAVPRAKQRGTICVRDSFKIRPLISQLGAPLLKYAHQVRERYESEGLPGSEAPLFPPRGRPKGTGLESHRSAAALSHLASQTLTKLQPHSERTGKPMRLFAYRFRRTVGTRAAQEGHSPLIIAEILDHTDTANVGVYVESVPAIAERIDKALAWRLAPLARAFAGKIIADEISATRAADRNSRIIDLRIERADAGVGNCGQCGPCELRKPIACYTCRSFEPWLDGPHQSVLDFLLGMFCINRERGCLPARAGAATM
jgi:hypothetical protein